MVEVTDRDLLDYCDTLLITAVPRYELHTPKYCRDVFISRWALGSSDVCWTSSSTCSLPPTPMTSLSSSTPPRLIRSLRSSSASNSWSQNRGGTKGKLRMFFWFLSFAPSLACHGNKGCRRRLTESQRLSFRLFFCFDSINIVGERDSYGTPFQL